MLMPPYADVIGDPIAHSKSPALHRFWLEALKIEGDYRAVQVAQGELDAFLARRRSDKDWRGCNVTAPWKEAAASQVDALTDRAAAIGAINLIFIKDGKLIGDNTDVDGVAEALPSASIQGLDVVVIGAGGAARAAVIHMVASKARRIRLFARRSAAAAHLQALGNPKCPIVTGDLRDLDASGADLFINASPLGMARAPMPAGILRALRKMSRGGRVFDMVYEPLATPLIDCAGQWNLKSVDGLAMLIGQADRSFLKLFGEAPPRHLDGELRAHLVGLA
jgi:shikimate dehydrogenase